MNALVLLFAALATGCPSFTVESPAPAPDAPVVRAVDFGLSVTGDRNATAINAAIAEARRIGAGRIELAPGTYRAFDEPGIVLKDLKDLTFDGKGAVLVFRRPPEFRSQPQSELVLEKGNLLVQGCERVEVKALTMDWDWQADPLSAFVICRDRQVDEAHPEASYLEFEFIDYERHPRYPEPVPFQKLEPMETRTTFGSGRKETFGQTEGHFGAKNEWVAPNRLRVWPGVPMPNRNQNPQTRYRYDPKRNFESCRDFPEGKLYRLNHYYYGKNGINLADNRHLKLTDVTVWSCFGMGLVVDGTQEYWEVTRLRVVPPTPEEFAAAYPGVRYFSRPMTSTSDGMHVARSRGHAKYIDCRWTLNNDDSINIHDRFTIAVKVGEKVLQIVNRRGHEYFRTHVGAELELRNPDFSPTGYRGRIERFYGEFVQGDVMYLDKPLPEMKGPCFIVWDRTYGTENVLVKGCDFLDSGNRNLFTASNLTIDNCRFVRTGHFPVRMILDYRQNIWCEGMGVTNVVIRNNYFENCAKARDGALPLISSVVVTPLGWEVGPVDTSVIGNFLVENNTFIEPKVPPFDFAAGTNIVERKNVTKLFPGVYGPKDPPPTNRVAALEAMSAVPPATAEVKQGAAGPELFVDGHRADYHAYRGDYDFKLFGEAGGNIVIPAFSLYRDISWMPALWRKEKGAFDFKRVEDTLLRIHAANPKARVILSVKVDPDRAWEESHPDSIFVNPKGERGRVALGAFRGFGDKPFDDKTDRSFWAYSYASEDWQRYAEEGLRALGEWLKTTPAGNIVIGFNLGGGMDGQFVQWEYKPEHGHFDYGEANRRALGAYLKGIYGTDAALQAAWGDTNVTFSTACNPTPKEFRAKKFYTDRPGVDRRICDCRRFISDGTARALNRLAKAAKAALGRPCVVSAWWTTAIWSQPSRLSLDELVRDHAVDILQSVSYYGTHRAVGGAGASANCTAASMAQRGILWVQELDHRTRRTVHTASKSMMSAMLPSTPEEFAEQVVRDATSVTAVGGRGFYFYDMQGSWYHEPEAMSVIRRAYAFNAHARAHAGAFRAPDVAIVMDEKTRLVGETLCYETPNALWRTSGVMPALHLLSDVDRADFPDYKLIILWQGVTLTRPQAEVLARRVERGASLVAVGRVGIASRDFAFEREAVAALGPKVRRISQLNAMTDDMLNLLAREAGAHVYDEPGNCLYVGNGVAYARRRHKEVKVDFGEDVVLVDPLTGARSAPLRVWEPGVYPGETASVCYLPVAALGPLLAK